MYLQKLMNERNMTRAELCKTSGVPDSTLRDILTGKVRLDRCKSGTLLRIANALETTTDSILEHFLAECPESYDSGYNDSDPTYLHDNNSLLDFYVLVDLIVQGRAVIPDTDMIRFILSEDLVEKMFSVAHYREGLFLVGLVDYLTRKHGLPQNPRFDVYRKYALDYPVYSLDTLHEYDDTFALEEAKELAEDFAIPELGAYNIFMTEEDIA